MQAAKVLRRLEALRDHFSVPVIRCNTSQKKMLIIHPDRISIDNEVGHLLYSVLSTGFVDM